MSNDDKKVDVIVEGLDIILVAPYPRKNILLNKKQAQSLRDDLAGAIENVINQEVQGS